MGVSLSFASREAVDPAVDRAIREDQINVNRQPWVLCEPPHFYPATADGRLRGSSKLNLHPYPDEFEEASKIVTERNDLEELIHRLCGWSERYDIAWELAIEGQTIGVIRDGTCSENLTGMIEAMAGVAQELAQLSPEEMFGHFNDENDEMDQG